MRAHCSKSLYWFISCTSSLDPDNALHRRFYLCTRRFHAHIVLYHETKLHVLLSTLALNYLTLLALTYFIVYIYMQYTILWEFKRIQWKMSEVQRGTKENLEFVPVYLNVRISNFCIFVTSLATVIFLQYELLSIMISSPEIIFFMYLPFELSFPVTVPTRSRQKSNKIVEARDSVSRCTIQRGFSLASKLAVPTFATIKR